jgi:hypothetical protein
MRTVVESRKRDGVASEGRGNESPSCITTTLYEVMAVLQDVVDPDHDRLVVATVVHLLRSGRLTRPRMDGARRGPWRRNDKSQKDDRSSYRQVLFTTKSETNL